MESDCSEITVHIDADTESLKSDIELVKDIVRCHSQTTDCEEGDVSMDVSKEYETIGSAGLFQTTGRMDIVIDLSCACDWGYSVETGFEADSYI